LTQRDNQIAHDHRMGTTRSRHHDDTPVDKLVALLAAFGPGKEGHLVHLYGQVHIHRYISHLLMVGAAGAVVLATDVLTETLTPCITTCALAPYVVSFSLQNNSHLYIIGFEVGNPQAVSVLSTLPGWSGVLENYTYPGGTTEYSFVSEIPIVSRIKVWRPLKWPERAQ
jgi:hypothetical protein